MDAEAVTRIHEHVLVERLFADLRLFQHIVIPPKTPWPAAVRLRVDFAALDIPAPLSGDADALLVPLGAPAESRAVEFKRILVPARSFATLTPNKLQELAKAAEQANKLVACGFACVWLTVLVMVDSRELSGGVGYVAASAALMDVVRAAVPINELDARVGVTLCEITQCFDRPVEQSGMLGGSLIRMAEVVSQPGELTSAIERLVAA
jgi:hypothetical protein